MLWIDCFFLKNVFCQGHFQIPGSQLASFASTEEPPAFAAVSEVDGCGASCRHFRHFVSRWLPCDSFLVASTATPGDDEEGDAVDGGDDDDDDNNTVILMLVVIIIDNNY